MADIRVKAKLIINYMPEVVVDDRSVTDFTSLCSDSKAHALDDLGQQIVHHVNLEMGNYATRADKVLSIVVDGFSWQELVWKDIQTD